MAAIPFGARRGWRFVRFFWWRAAHLAALVVVALQALLGRACFLTDWEWALQRAAGQPATGGPLIAGWVRRAIYWPLAMWAFTFLYMGVLAAALALWRLVPPERRP